MQRIFVFLFLLNLPVLAQTERTYYERIQPIIAKNCVVCHQPGGIGPFSLLSYQDVAKRAQFVAKVTTTRYMPPFPADRSFQHYANERGLTEAEMEQIRQWAAEKQEKGKGWKGKVEKEKDGAVRAESEKGQFSGGRNEEKNSLVTPDLSLKMQQPFQIPNTSTEEFRYFYLPTNLQKDMFVETIEFLPGNRKVLHHSRVMVDTSGKMADIEGIRADDETLQTFQKIPMADQFLYGWVPGNDQIHFPKGIAKRIPAKANLVLNLHYSPSAKPQTDQSVINFYAAKTPVEREVQSLTLYEAHISNPPFLIKANTRPTFYINHGPIQEAISAISILPHLHWLGKSFKAFAITPDGDLVPLVKIDNWDFNWQMTYQFEKLLYVPKGSVIIAEATYDNTIENPLNPFTPPRDVSYGWNTTSEMMELVIYYVPYRAGDEHISQNK